MPPGEIGLPGLLGAFADPAGRPAAARALARALGGEGLALFAPDPELGVLLPAPGLPQTLNGAARWRHFLDRCVEHGAYQGTLPDGAGGSVP
ncbi:MAG: Histidine kinase, partial [Gemmatimonadetes bacterium]|nr:Histidine kinase [Gemmatimonadota bacterium]